VKTECHLKHLEFDSVRRRKLVAAFDGEHISSDGGLALLHRTDQRFELMRKFAACFKDLRRPELIEHSVEELVRQRVFESEPHQQPLASPSTLNRLELTPADATAQARYRKVVYDGRAIEDFFVEAFLDPHPEPLGQVVLDLDATDDPIHCTQEGRFFHGYISRGLPRGGLLDLLHPLAHLLSQLLRIEGLLHPGVAHPLQEVLGRLRVRPTRDEHHPPRPLW
jgi:hypothetical protein